jgi:hypothetical protein
MHRYDNTVGIINCSTDLATMNAITQSGGLRVIQGRTPHQFRIADSGRRTEPEVGRELFKIVEGALDRAASAGKIPPWSIAQTED